MKKIPFSVMFKMNLGLLLIDKALLILSILSIIMGFSVNTVFIIMKTNADFITFYNFFFLFFTGAFWIIITMRLVFLFLYSKIEDKTIYIISVHQISRKKIFISQWSVMIMFSITLSLINFLMINIISLIVNLDINLVVFRTTLVHFIYTIFISICLINFFTLLSLLLKSSITTILITLMLAATFISSLPYQFLKNSEKLNNISFNSNVGTPYVSKIDNVYNVFDLQHNIKNGYIKYPNLSKHINDYFVENQFRKDQFSSSSNLKLRYDFWNSLGVINNKSVDINSSDLTIKSLPKQWTNPEIIQGSKVELNLTFNYLFYSVEEIESIIVNMEDGSKEKIILIELIEFTKSINSFYIDDFSFQNETRDVFGDMVSLKQGYIKSKNGSQETVYNESNLKNSYQLHFIDGLDGVQFQNSKESKELFEDNLYNPLYLSVRLLENYFINYTSDFVIFNNYKVNTTSEEWKKYSKLRTGYNIFYMFNFIGSTMSIYTNYSGLSYDDIWFDPSQKSNIDLIGQQNIFLNYHTYTFKLDENNKMRPDSYNNYIKSYWFLFFQLFIASINFTFGIYFFNRKDLT
ncbi:ABC transporter permease [Spiroplasma cantharicola]|uniref:Uncharacterized protein n=1 Tax=Spiroplasma cantharicola TaxID=362837 RepID=A0A0M4JW37_9MOLU|nr:ABC transporter permease [Spiroplasma cantharicola]ALD66092.1 hypothetical protein SCANT_v1c01820 [Spiroplasma cantharicola]